MEKTAEEKLNDLEKNSKQFVTTRALSFALGIITVVIGWLFVANAALSARVDKMSGDYMAIQTQLSQIQTDLVWIKTAMSKDSK